MATMTHAEAMYAALALSLDEDQRVHVIGGGLFDVDLRRELLGRLRRAYGARFYEPPVSESAMMAIAAGAAMAGDRPIVGVSTASFVYEAWQQLVNEAAPAHYMSNGQLTVPITVFMQHGLRGSGAAQHSHSPHAMLAQCPGIEIVLPATPADMKGLVRTAIKSENPTVILDHAKLFMRTGEVPEGDYAIPFGQAEVKHAGTDVTVVATSYAVISALEAADILARENISVEVVDPRTVVPLDRKAILESVAKTGRLVVADEGTLSCGFAGEIAAMVADVGFGSLKAPIRRVTRPDVPAPFAPNLEEAIRPNTARIVEAVRSVPR
jgi:pyruvate dehydrogenase E1 component beta subunit